MIMVLYCISSVAQIKTQRDTASKPLIIGETDEIISSVLPEKRVLNIYLPDDYKSSDTVKYPVIYLLDGGIDEDFIHVTGLAQFNSFSWVARMPKSIIVGIVNVDRKRDFTFPTNVNEDEEKYPTTGGSKQFMLFIEKELQPYIASKFRTTGSKTIIGESLGGLLAIDLLFTKPALFDKYIIISPSIWWDNASILNRGIDLNKSIKDTTDIYIGVGKEGLAPGKQPHIMQADARHLKELIESFHNKKIRVYFDYLPAENHATISHQAIFNAFKKIYYRSAHR
jgi:predicted alpha/beta superfamily hydrolase